MAFPWMAAATAAGAAGAYLGAGASNRYGMDAARENREFQYMMSRNAHQYGIQDLTAAGLNPILSATSGMSAATPGGSMATGFQNKGAAAGTAALQGAQVATAKQTQSNLKKQGKVLDQQGIQAKWNAGQAYYDMYSSLRSLQGLELDFQRKWRDTRTHEKMWAGDLDIADFHSSKEMAKKRRIDAGLETAGKGADVVRRVLPWGGLGQKR